MVKEKSHGGKILQAIVFPRNSKILLRGCYTNKLCSSISWINTCTRLKPGVELSNSTFANLKIQTNYGLRTTLGKYMVFNSKSSKKINRILRDKNIYSIKVYIILIKHQSKYIISIFWMTLCRILCTRFWTSTFTSTC